MTTEDVNDLPKPSSERCSLLRSNQELTPEEKSAKRDLKKLLKLQSRRKKLRNRLKQAIGRGDHIIAQQAREDLQRSQSQEMELQEQLECKAHIIISPKTHSEEIGDSENEMNSGSNCDTFKEQEASGRNWIERIYVALQSKFQAESAELTLEKPSERKIAQTEQARELLLNMTRGTQTPAMFNNEDAIKGYTRQKFQERAVLVLLSLNKLDPLHQRYQRMSGAARHKHELFWDSLLRVRTVCSIGCGPGCDAVGVLAFLSFSAQKRQDCSLLERVIFMDWTIQQWDKILVPLGKMLTPDKISEFSLVPCDVRQPLKGTTNSEALESVTSPRTHDVNAKSSTLNLFVTSYLLTETREKWHEFFMELVEVATPGSLFLFTDPTAWQLHTFKEKCASAMDFIWLDSSMDSPPLQALEGRVGPAVLIGRMK